MNQKRTSSFLKASGGLAGLGLLLVIIVAANIILGNVRLRVDLTDEKLYTLSDGTRSILKQLDEPVTLKLFYSKSYAGVPIALKNYAKQVEDLLKEYKLAGKGQVIIEMHDPKPDSDAEDAARRYGVAAQQVEMFGPSVYIGLAAVAGETEGVIPALDPRNEGLLEYHITRLIYRVVNPQKPVVGVMSSLPVLGTQAPPSFGFPPQGAQQPSWLAFREIEDDYELRQVETTAEEIPPDIRALIVVHPKDLGESALYAIDQFVLRGGHLLAFVDPFSASELESAPPQQPFAPPSNASSLDPLFRAWGVQFDVGQMLADMKAVSRLAGQGNQVEESPVFLTLRADHISKEDTLTSQLGSLMLPLSGAFEDRTADDLVYTSLIRSSDMAGLVNVQMARFGSQAITRDFKPSATPLDLAVRLNGVFNTAYPNGKPMTPAGEGEEGAATPGGESLQTGESVVILVGDSDLIFDRFCVRELNFFGAKAFQPLNDNVNFFANAIEQMAGSSDMIGIRSRGEFARPFDMVLKLEEEARQDWQEQEKRLTEKLQETRRQLSQLQSEKDNEQQLFLNREQEAAIKRFRDEEIRVGKELKIVRKNLRHRIERLGLQVKLANIVLMPLLVAIGGVTYGLRRKGKRS